MTQDFTIRVGDMVLYTDPHISNTDIAAIVTAVKDQNDGIVNLTTFPDSYKHDYRKINVKYSEEKKQGTWRWSGDEINDEE